MRIEIGIPTKDRYDQLALLLWSLLEQDYKDWDVTIIDDSEERVDIREISFILPMLKRMDYAGHEWRVNFGKKKGPHYCHQQVLDETRHPWIFRVDDDCILDRAVLSNLVKAWEELDDGKLGAIGPIVTDSALHPDVRVLPIGWRSYKKFQGKVESNGMNYGDNQWRLHPDNEYQEVQHIYSSFLYRADVGKEVGYNLDYNVVGHREETDFSYSIHKKGYKLFIQPSALVWHLRNPKGGIRTYDQTSLWADCHRIFLEKFGFRAEKNKDRVIKVFGGLGDHLCMTPLFRDLKRAGKKVVVSAIYHPIFAGNKNVDEIIFTDEENQYAKVDFRDLYKWAFETGFTGKLSEAWCKMYDAEYDGDELDYTVFPAEKKWVKTHFPDVENTILISTTGGVPVIQYIDTDKTNSGGQRTHVKDWYNDRWEALVEEIKAKGYKVVQVGGMRETPIKACDMNMAGVFSYRLTLALAEQCKTWISVDTFLGHAGHAVKKPGIALFGATDPEIFGHKTNINIFHPICNSRECVQGGEPKFQWLTQSSECKKENNCMDKITVEEVLSSLDSLL